MKKEYKIELNMFNEKLVTSAREAGFTDAQIEWMIETFAFEDDKDEY
jgi:hypothetical protein